MKHQNISFTFVTRAGRCTGQLAEAKRLRAIWDYWEEGPEESGDMIDEQLHPDHLIPH